MIASNVASFVLAVLLSFTMLAQDFVMGLVLDLEQRYVSITRFLEHQSMWLRSLPLILFIFLNDE